MKRVLSQTKTSFRDKGSKFIGYLFPAQNQPDFDNELEKLKSTYPDATHHCYAWRLNPAQVEEFAQDDGEPGGTAGLPILNQLKSFEVINAGIVVVRYYGGTNLGKSGLIKAYSSAAERCLKQAGLKSIRIIQKVEITYPYNEQNAIEQLMHQFEMTEIASSYTENVTLILGCPVNGKQKLERQLKQLKHRNVNVEFLEKSYL